MDYIDDLEYPQILAPLLISSFVDSLNIFKESSPTQKQADLHQNKNEDKEQHISVQCTRMGVIQMYFKIEYFCFVI